MRRGLTGLAVALCALSVVAGPSRAAPSGTAGHGSIRPVHQALGRSLGEWIGAWWQHYLQLPLPENPLVGNGSRCDRVSRVLMPVYGAGHDADCTVRPGTWVLLNVWTAECSTVEPPPFHGSDPAELTRCTITNLANALPDSITVTVDGVPVGDVWSSTGTSPAVTVDLPADNYLVPGAATTQIVAGGWAVLVRPLRPGTHVLQVCLTGANVGPFAGCDGATVHVVRGRRGVRPRRPR